MRLTRSIIWNIAGTSLPLVVGVGVVPVIIRELGTERFGFLSVIWMLIGYLSIFDLGLSRTLTKLVADRLAIGRESDVAPLASTAFIIVLVCSTVVGAIVALLSDYLAHRIFGTSPTLVPEARAAILWLSVSLPFVLLATALTGLLEAYQQFPATNAVRIPFGSLMLATPLAVIPFTHDLGDITAALAAVRVLNAGVLCAITFKVIPQLRGHMTAFRRDFVGPLMSFGGWLTISSVVGPMMVYFDRFLIAATLGGTAVAYYTVPYDILNRLLAIPNAIQGVLFPTFATLRAQGSPRAVSVFTRSSTYTILLMIPPLIGVMLFSTQGLAIWISGKFALHAASIARILMIGIVLNAMARTPLVFVQGAGYAKWTGLLHLIELPCYGVALWVLIKANGIDGVAYAWSGRVAVDTIALYAMSVRLEPNLSRGIVRDSLWVTASCVLAVCLDRGLHDLPLRVAFVILPTIASVAFLLVSIRATRPAAAN